MSEREQAENIVGQIREIQGRGHSGWIVAEKHDNTPFSESDYIDFFRYDNMLCIRIEEGIFSLKPVLAVEVGIIRAIVERTRTGNIVYNVK